MKNGNGSTLFGDRLEKLLEAPTTRITGGREGPACIPRDAHALQVYNAVTIAQRYK